MENVIFRCWNDSSHIVATKYFKKNISTQDEELLKNNASKENVLNTECDINKDFNSVKLLKSYESEYFKENGFVSSSCSKFRKDKDSILEKAYFESLNLKKNERLEFIKNYLKEYDHSIFSDNYIEKYLIRKEKSIISRTDRFRKKALNNSWNYFVTITYDDKKHNEITFKEKLKKCLSNFHTRYGYKYMGVFERSKIGRLHFHALFYIPLGQLKGKINEIKDFSIEDKRMRVAHVNSFFENKFGRNDFIKIDSKKLMKDNTINYLLKYIGKSDEPIFYSRGIATYHYLVLKDDDVICMFGNFIKKYVLYDDVFEDESRFVIMRC